MNLTQKNPLSQNNQFPWIVVAICALFTTKWAWRVTLCALTTIFLLDSGLELLATSIFSVLVGVLIPAIASPLAVWLLELSDGLTQEATQTQLPVFDGDIPYFNPALPLDHSENIKYLVSLGDRTF